MDRTILLKLFQRHRLFPIAEDLLPLLGSEDREIWKERIKYQTLRSMHLWTELVRFQEIIGDQGIDLIPLKGPVLAHQLYGNVGQRQFSDLDILVRQQDIFRVIQLGEEEGFEMVYPRRDLSDQQWKHYFSFKKDVGLLNRDKQVFIEIHTGIDNQHFIGEDTINKFWNERIRLTIGGTPFQCFNSSHHFLYLALHGVIHQYFRLFWLRDVAAAMENWDLDHGWILGKSIEWGMERPLGLSLLLAKEICGAEIPAVYEPVLRENDKILQTLTKICHKRIMGPEDASTRQRLKRHYYIALLRPGWKQSLQVLRGLGNRRYIGRYLGGH